MKLFDLTKKGTIIIGQIRSGSHLLAHLVQTELEKNNIVYHYNGEYFKDILAKSNSPKRYDFLNVVDKIKEQDTSTDYSVGTIVYPTSLDLISQHRGNREYFFSSYHIIKLVRKDLMAQLMSTVIFGITGIHNNVRAIPKLVDVPYTLTQEQLGHAMFRLLEFDRFKCPNVVFYEDISNKVTDRLIKNFYGLTPKDFFKNYDFIVEQIKHLNIKHNAITSSDNL